ncbi:glutamate carboxypeptidase [Massilia endophytica]|uniref:glutamate carboxypeptidase n=1 Tax=Massilia endophytica TaxID=2899220 RepID=UPI001E2DDB3E|nr:glutamate carboxypeptidase [Massilia endophytica]UGQ47233.1 glutamate carboxypeptidase [Massilia endophytica]
MARKLVAGAVMALAGLGASAQTPDAALLKRAEQVKPEALKLLGRMVNIDSGTFSEKGLNAVGALASAELKKLGFKVETFSAAPAAGKNIVATLNGKGKGRVLLVAHMDTVYADGTAKANPFRIEGSRAYGPGIMDDKGGIVVALYALKLLKESGFRDFARITVLLNTNEETGSHGSRELIEKTVKEHDVALNLEPGRAADGVVIARKGSGEIGMEVQGKAAHAGVAAKQGVNAAMEAAHQVIQLSELGNEEKGTTVNWTVLKSGDRSNVIPDLATAQADIRVSVPEEFDRVEQDIARISSKQLIKDAKVSIHLRRGFPPMPQSPVTDALAAKANEIYGELGRKLTLESTGGAADASLMFAAGVPTLDGLGIVGGGIHTPGEYAEIESIPPRVYLLARLIQEAGKGLQLPR